MKVTRRRQSNPFIRAAGTALRTINLPAKPISRNLTPIPHACCREIRTGPGRCSLLPREISAIPTDSPAPGPRRLQLARSLGWSVAQACSEKKKR
jgi:hypothetical protein